MTTAEAVALRMKWIQQVDPPACEHMNQELESNEMGYLTGNYLCTTCGELVATRP
jgi:hypothetical protein